MDATRVFIAIAPFLIFVLFIIKKNTLLSSSLITLALVSVSALVFWKILPIYFAASLLKGFFVALDIFLIIFGAIFFLEISRSVKIIDNISIYLESVSKDIRVQVILLAWFFENFLEGTAGFGTPSTVVAPILVSLGLSPINAVIIALLGNSSSVVFGAAGTPIKVGLGNLAGTEVVNLAASLNFIGIIVPVFMLWFLTRGKINSKKDFLDALPFALWAGLAFSLPSFLSSFIGQEFPSILGAVIGLALVILTLKLGILVPKFDNDMEASARVPSQSFVKSGLPYICLILLLIAGKFILGSSGLAIPLLVKHTFSYFNPGFAFLISGLFTLLIFKKNIISVKKPLIDSFKKSVEPFLIIAFMSGIAQIMVNSIHNTNGLASMIDYLANSVKNSYLPMWAPLLGAFGSFLTGSATVSNLMFGNYLAQAAKDLFIKPDLILALALVGGAAGNMIALADVVAAETVVGLKNEEFNVLKKVILPCLIYIIFVGLIGMASGA